MARPIQDGLRYFPLDVDADYDDKIQLIEGLHGAIGFAVVIKMFMKIYSSGYFYKWEDKELILIAKRIGIDSNSVNNIVNDCIKYELFQEKLFEEYRILTSDGIQKRYFTAVGKKKKGEVIKEYLLIDEAELHEMCPLMVFKSVIPEKTIVIPRKTEVIPDSGTQIKLNKIKENEIKENETKVNEIKVNGIDNPEQLTLTTNVHKFFQENIGMENMVIAQGLDYWVTDIGEDLVMEAILRASKAERPSYSLVEWIMKDFLQKNIQTIEEAKAAEAARQRSSMKKNNAPKKEKMPDWAENIESVTETAPDPDQQRAIQERIARLKTSQKREMAE